MEHPFSPQPNMEDSIHNSNMDFGASVGPTLAYIAILMVFGLVGNSLVFLVYYKRFKPSSTRTYILTMSVFDLLTNCLALPSDIHELRFHYDFNDDSGCKFFGFITRFLALSGAFILIAIAVDRRRKICQLMKKQRSTKDVYVELTCLGVLSVCLSCPYGVLKGLQTIPVQGSNITRTVCYIDDRYVGSLFYVIYNASMFLTFIICVSIMSVCYALIARHLYLHKKRLFQNAKRRHSPGLNHDSNQASQPFQKCTEDAQAIGRSNDQLEASVSTFIRKPSKDGDDKASVEKLKLNIVEKSTNNNLTNKYSEDEVEYKDSTIKLRARNTEDLELCGTDNNTIRPQTNRMMSPHVTSISETETRFQHNTAPEDVCVEHTLGTSGNNTAEKGNSRYTMKTFRKAATVVDDCRAPKDSNAAQGQVYNTKNQKSKNSGKKMPKRTTLMMFILTATFVVSYLPYLFMAALFGGKDIVGDNFWEWNLHQIALRSSFINSAINPLVYSFCSVKFRRECYLLMCRK